MMMMDNYGYLVFGIDGVCSFDGQLVCLRKIAFLFFSTFSSLRTE